MNIIPSELIAIPDLPGYFWHPREAECYSLKVTGTLKKLKNYYPRREIHPGHVIPSRYVFSHKGKKTYRIACNIQSLGAKDYILPYKDNAE